MKISTLSVILALALVGACSKQQSAAQPSDGSSAATAAAAPAGPLACVKDVPESAVCTMDVNSCGHAGSCECDAGYVYNASIGMCVLDLANVKGQSTKTPVGENDCIRPTKGACTKDINACGHPTRCDCEEGYDWDAAAGECVRRLG
ncbi:MAG: hypothetical protein GC153_11590 [Alphaproteobacteria bacterium]|nr:hypothetical protein [Alphaproteobacteria bacterium]